MYYHRRRRRARRDPRRSCWLHRVLQCSVWTLVRVRESYIIPIYIYNTNAQTRTPHGHIRTLTLITRGPHARKRIGREPFEKLFAGPIRRGKYYNISTRAVCVFGACTPTSDSLVDNKCRYKICIMAWYCNARIRTCLLMCYMLICICSIIMLWFSVYHGLIFTCAWGRGDTAEADAAAEESDCTRFLIICATLICFHFICDITRPQCLK